MQKQTSTGSAKKRENKPQNDYYTVQNTRNPSFQNSSLQTSRNQNSTLGNKDNSHANTKDEQSNTITQQNKALSPNRGSLTNMLLENKSQQDRSAQGSVIGVTNTNQHAATSKNQANKSSRHSLINDQQKSRALSNVKSGQLEKQSFGSAVQIHKQQQQKKSSNAQQIQINNYLDNPGQNKQIKKSVIVHQQSQHSPKPFPGDLKNGIFRSPQQPKKQNEASHLQSSVFLSNSNSPMPSTQHSKNQKMGSQSEVQKPGSRINNNKAKSSNNMQAGLKQKPNAVASTPSCLQIDLSSLSNKNEEEQHQAIASSHNAQSLYNITQNHNKSSNNRKKSSISQNKKTPNHIVSQSPSIINQASSQFSAKSPKNLKQGTAQSSNRHSVLTNSKANKATPKVYGDNNFTNNKSSTQKISKQAMQSTTIIPFNKTEQKSIEDVDEKSIKIEVKQIVKSSAQDQKKSSFQQKSRESIGELDNFSFNSNSNSKTVKQKQSIIPDQNDYEYNFNEEKLQISDEKSNLQTKNSSLLQQASQNNLLTKTPAFKKEVESPLKQEKPKESEGVPKKEFLEKYQEQLLNFEIKEVEELKDQSIYFIGNSIKDRSANYLKVTKGNTKAESEVQKSLDDEEGYYNVMLGDHLMYRYEVTKILGKGSFAQVVSCIDHKKNIKVAVKITRNTEIDHKFASSESKLLNFLMSNDPNDDHNVVRLIDEFYFRDHHCFVFELLHSDLFEHLKENGFIGFDTGKIRSYAIQILEALIFLEKHQIIHCDLKPENILLKDESCESLKLVDYGSGCFRNEQVYTYVQSRFYRAPEVILRIPYSEKVDIWSFGCILAELYTGEPLFPGNNEQEQLELIMEICGIPPEKMIDKSRKKDHYFDVDYSPFLIEEEDMGILRIPESKKLEDCVQCSDDQFIDFIRQCLVLDPEDRFTASQAREHPWIKQGLPKTQTVSIVNSIQSLPTMARRREDECDGVKGNVYEESPVRPIKEKPKKSFTKHFNFQTIKVGLANEDLEGESNISTPKNEGGFKEELSGRVQDIGAKDSVEIEKIKSETEVNKPQNINLVNLNQPKIIGKEKAKGVKMIGKYEIVRSDEEMRDSNSRTSGIASEATIPAVNQHDGTINNENTINKITITFYQKRTNKKH